MKSKAICILGMHRSGTSTITRAVNFLGPYIGQEKDMVEPGFDNPEGFWELRDVVNLHKRIMTAFKRGEDDTVAPFPRQWHLMDEVRPFKDELGTVVHRHFAGQALWAWKDPRTCLTLELWKELLIESGTALSVIFVVRNPLDVAISLKKRNGLSFHKSFGFWFNHNISALASLQGVPTVFVSYDRFLEEWEPELRRCAKGLDIAWPKDELLLRENMGSFIRPTLRHSKSSLDELRDVPAPVRELYRHILDQTADSTAADASFFERVDGLFRDFHDYASFFGPDFDDCFERSKRLADLKKHLVDYEKRLIQRDQNQVQSDIDTFGCEVFTSDTEQQLRDCCSELDAKDKLLSEYACSMADQDRKLAECCQLLAERDLRMQEILDSASWRITAPARWVSKFLGSFHPET